jgi:hypothetical protein
MARRARPIRAEAAILADKCGPGQQPRTSTRSTDVGQILGSLWRETARYIVMTALPVARPSST